MKKIFSVFFLIFILLTACSESEDLFVPDTTAPVITASFPTNNQINIPINLIQIQVIFSESVNGVDSSSLTIDNGVLGIVNYDFANKTAIFTITNGNLAVSSSYSVTLSSNIQDNANNALVTTEFSFTSGTTSDTTAPSWISGWPKYDNITENSFNLKYEINEAGRVYYLVVTNNSIAPTPAQVTNGDNYSGALVVASGSVVAEENIEGTIKIDGLSANTTYDVYAVSIDNFNNLSASPVTHSLTTLQGELPLGSWVEGSLVASQANSYYFNTTAGESYAVYWDDSYEGSGPYTADVMVSAFNSDYSITIFDQVDSGYDLPQLITNASGGKYYIKVEEYGSGDHGTYAIKVVPAYTVSGTITLPSSVTDVTNAVLISTSSNFYDEPQVYEYFVANGIASSYSLAVPAGTYYVFGLFDLNKDGDYVNNSGDYLGYWGGSGINPPSTVNLIVDGNKPGINFNVSLIP